MQAPRVWAEGTTQRQPRGEEGGRHSRKADVGCVSNGCSGTRMAKHWLFRDVILWFPKTVFVPDAVAGRVKVWY